MHAFAQVIYFSPLAIMQLQVHNAAVCLQPAKKLFFLGPSTSREGDKTSLGRAK